MTELLALSSSGIVRISDFKGLLAVGGSASSGVKVPGLKNSDNYAVIGESGGEVSLHLLRGKKKGQITLQPDQPFYIEDLILVAVVRSAESLPTTGLRLEASLQELLQRFSEPGRLEPTLEWFLSLMIESAEMEKGVLIARSTESEDFHAISKKGVKEGDPWLTEALVKETLSSGRALWIHNRIGSAFESNKSLIAAGFLSVFALPLVARGEVLGAIVVGSNKPHGGIDPEKRVQLEALARVGSLLFWFHRREEMARREIERLSEARAKLAACPMLTVSTRLEQEIEIARRVAGTRLSILIQGETGTGKELMAQWIHEQSERAKSPFVALNCGAIPAELLESILFGHRKGAFTGAISDQNGKFLQAHGGTLLLDEVGDLPERLQVKLLRVLQEGSIDPLGSPRPVKVDVRVIAATHRNLPELVKKGQFRQDLYFRIAETVVTLPPLRERPEDIALLATHFLAQVTPEKKLTPSTLQWLATLPWPGNVRELQSAIRRAAALGVGNELGKDAFLLGLPHANVSSASSDHWLGGETLEEARQRFIQEKIRLALERSGGNRQQAAELLGVTPRTLFRYLEDARQPLHDA